MKNFSIILCTLILFSCAGKNSQQTKNQHVETKNIPVFNADSAYFFVKKQVDFGARVPQSKAHKKCADFLKTVLENYGAVAEFQFAKGKLYDGKSIDIQNITGKFNVSAKNRILLCAHYDSRPFADNDENTANHHTPVLGANDGASGVGILLEIARNLKNLPENIGIDIVFFDVEDYGTPQFYTGRYNADSWCIGSREWAKEAQKQNYSAQFGILLDMVGAPNARFYKEQGSMEYAPHVVEKVWNTALALGFDGYFVSQQGGAIIDDHVNINQLAKIPCIDIIQFEPNSQNGFGDYWHTLRDDMRNIDRNTLYAVGTTILNVIF
ncbi:MAG: M28 family peptidase [Prevotellaceae bacterium]|jgi:hypothetical protein|nr:M28 family peptidase [Prevotellaceae bacterium]